jgi:hypothetical protein
MTTALVRRLALRAMITIHVRQATSSSPTAHAQEPSPMPITTAHAMQTTSVQDLKQQQLAMITMLALSMM